MRTKITCFAVLALALGTALLASTADARYQDKWWEKTVAGVTLKQGVAMDLNRTQGSLWGSTVTWASATLAYVYARNVGGENCGGWPYIYWDNTRVSYNTNNVSVTRYTYYPASRPCWPRIMAVRGWSQWLGQGIDQSHDIALYEGL
jgi:hypothetical protein